MAHESRIILCAIFVVVFHTIEGVVSVNIVCLATITFGRVVCVINWKA